MQIRLELEDSLGAEVDDARGDVPRVVWIRRAIEMRLGRTREMQAADQFARKVMTPTEVIDEHREFLEGGVEAQAKAVQRNRAIRAEVPQRTDDVTRQEQPVATVIPEECSHPRSAWKVHGWGTLCGLCNKRIER